MNKFEIVQKLLLPILNKMTVEDRSKPIVVKFQPGTQEWLKLLWVKDRLGYKPSSFVKMCVDSGFENMVKVVLANGKQPE